jgi:hypothetical protein
MTGDKLDYIYVNPQAPKEKINYSYSKFGGEKFMQCWEVSRKKYLINKNELKLIFKINTNSNTEKLFLGWIEDFEQNCFNNFNELKLLIKRFEVTRKIYDDYDENFRKKEKYSFDESRLYLLFAFILIQAYEKEKMLYYLNALLKLNDINLGFEILKESSDELLLQYCVKKELEFIYNLKEKLG